MNNLKLYPRGNEPHFKSAIRFLERYKGPLDTVIDIGAHIGSLSLMAANMGAKQVIAVEASSENFKDLIFNIKINSYVDIITPIHAMITLNTNEQRYLCCQNKHQHSGQRSMIVNQAIIIEAPPLIGFKQFLSEFKIIDYLKIDIEAGEYELFDQSLELENLLRRVRYLDIELHLLEDFNANCTTITKYSHGDTACDELTQYLRDIGFTDDPIPEVFRDHDKHAFGSRNFNFIGG